MIPYELGLGILVLALASTFNAAFANRRGLSFMCLSLATFGITGLAKTQPAYSQFFMFAPQIILLFAVAVLYCRPGQRLFLSLIGAGLLVGFVFSETWTQEYLDRATGQLGLFVALILLPTLVFKVETKSLDRVDQLISVQQFWLRISLLVWCRENIVNLQHYDVFASYIEVGSIAIGAVFLVRMLFKKTTWMFNVKSLMSAVLLLSALTMDRSEMKLLLAWILVVGFVDMLPVQNDARILRRMNLGGFGGASFWGMCLFVLSAPMDGWYRFGWILLVFIAAFSAFILPIPDRKDELHHSSNQIGALMFLGLFLQAAFFGLLIFWPEIKLMGV